MAISDFRTGFARIARLTATAAGSWQSFAINLALVVGFLIVGLILGFTDYIQLVANTFTTLVTYLLVFIILNTQNRDTAAMSLKLDELIRATERASNRLIASEDMTDEVIAAERARMTRLSRRQPGDR